MNIALASRVASCLEEGLANVQKCLAEAAARGAQIACFPEAYLPGLRGLDFEVPPFDAAQQERVLGVVAGWARADRVAAILGLERLTDRGRQTAAVLSARGETVGCQLKTQLAPAEDALYATA